MTSSRRRDRASESSHGDQQPPFGLSDDAIAQLTIAIADVVFDIAWDEFIRAAGERGWDIGSILDESAKASAKAATLEPFRGRKQ